MTRVQWEWRFLDGDEQVLDRPLSPAFTSRFDAEAWVGEQWRYLTEHGVAAAVLLRHGEPVDAPLALRTT